MLHPKSYYRMRLYGIMLLIQILGFCHIAGQSKEGLFDEEFGCLRITIPIYFDSIVGGHDSHWSLYNDEIKIWIQFIDLVSRWRFKGGTWAFLGKPEYFQSDVFFVRILDQVDETGEGDRRFKILLFHNCEGTERYAVEISVWTKNSALREEVLKKSKVQKVHD